MKETRTLNLAAGMLIVLGLAVAVMAAHTYTSTENCTVPIASNLQWEGSYAGTTEGSIAVNRDGYLITTAADPNAVHGIIPKSTGSMAATNFFKTSDEPYLIAKIKTPAALTGIKFLVGFTDQEPDDDAATAATPSDASLVEGAWFYYDQASNSGKLTVGYRDQAGVDVTTQVIDVTLAVSSEYTLQVSFDSDREPHFAVNGTEYHAASTALADVDVEPRLYLRANNKTLYVRELTVGKNY